MGSNAATMVLKYFMVNSSTFLKGFHNRTYFYSSGTILTRVGTRLKRYMLMSVQASSDEQSEEETCEEAAGAGKDADAGEDAEDGEDAEAGEEADASKTKSTKTKKLPPMDPETMIRKVIYTRLCTYTCMCAYVRHI